MLNARHPISSPSIQHISSPGSSLFSSSSPLALVCEAERLISSPSPLPPCLPQAAAASAVPLQPHRLVPTVPTPAGAASRGPHLVLPVAHSPRGPSARTG